MFVLAWLIWIEGKKSKAERPPDTPGITRSRTGAKIDEKCPVSALLEKGDKAMQKTVERRRNSTWHNGTRNNGVLRGDCLLHVESIRRLPLTAWVHTQGFEEVRKGIVGFWELILLIWKAKAMHNGNVRGRIEHIYTKEYVAGKGLQERNLTKRSMPGQHEPDEGKTKNRNLIMMTYWGSREENYTLEIILLYHSHPLTSDHSWWRGNSLCTGLWNFLFRGAFGHSAASLWLIGRRTSQPRVV